MEGLFREIAGYIALAVEVVSALIIAYGAIEAIYGLFVRVIRPRPDDLEFFSRRKMIFLQSAQEEVKEVI